MAETFRAKKLPPAYTVQGYTQTPGRIAYQLPEKTTSLHSADNSNNPSRQRGAAKPKGWILIKGFIRGHEIASIWNPMPILNMPMLSIISAAAHMGWGPDFEQHWRSTELHAATLLHTSCGPSLSLHTTLKCRQPGTINSKVKKT